jgi:uncharacterized protein (DUF427 family)
VKIPGPDHPIAIAENPRRVVVRAGGVAIADSRRALVLREASYPPVQYIPRDDVDMSRLERTAHRTTCPFKGDAAYFSILAREPGQSAVENVAWSYETPHVAVAAIAGHLAFYPTRVDSVEEIDPA